MQSKDVRQSFIEFFAARGHLRVASAPLVPHGDPTLLFTNAGMVPFKDYFLGRETPPGKRAVSVQKCLRVSGKHNDLENVGPSPRHHTFFEMLGNFSFGDYFKAEAIEYGWQLVTATWGLSPGVLTATVFEQDDEAAELWRKISGLPAERIHRCGAKDNFWAMGDTGPCGPCSEIYVDLEPERPAVRWDEGTESGRYLEIWNLVFMQFDRAADGTLTPLPNPSIDTGAGLERVTAVLQGAGSNYDTDLFRPIIGAVAELSRREYQGGDGADAVAMRVIADHLRAVTFLLADGVIPSNEGRGYVLRRILRRAVRHGMHLGFEEPFLHRLVPVLGEVMGDAYPELAGSRQGTITTVRAEEEKFLATVATGARQVQVAIETARRAGNAELGGPAVFQLYDTFGLPLELIREIAEEERFAVDQAGFERALEEQRQRSRSATGEQQKRLGSLRQVLGGAGEPGSEFVGYDSLQLRGARALRLAAEGDAGRPAPVDALAAGEQGVAVFDRTPFYAEAGGQVGDQGEVRWPDGRARVLDVQKDTSGTYYHSLRVEEGRLERGALVDLAVGESTRRDTERNHTATHLLHAALRGVLGDAVRQAGSLVAPDRLRFDFTLGRGLGADELRRVEDVVNERVRQAIPTRILEQGYQEAVGRGAMALFGEKYGDRVRTVEVPGFSLELCGGCHVRNTGEIGLFVVLAERGIASGVRRIEALTGRGAVEHVRQREALAAATATALGVPLERAAEEARALHERLKASERELARVRRRVVAGTAAPAEQAREVGGIKVLAREVPPAPPEELRDMADMLRQKLGSGVVVLGARGEGKVSLVAAVTADLIDRVHAGNLVKAAATAVGGRGGGRPDFAQAGGKEPEKLPAALAAAVDEVAHQLADYAGQ